MRREWDARARKDSRVQTLAQALTTADSADKPRLQHDVDELFNIVHSEKLGEVAAEFDRIHTVHRALKVGALQEILPPADLRPYLIRSLERGLGNQKGLQSREAQAELPLKVKVAVATLS